MTIGEKIKKIRTAKLMTQTELAGGEITRNMLSRIENGASNPSLETLEYIADRLNVSAGFLLADEDDEVLYFKSNEISNIKNAYAHKNYRLCRDMCQNSEWSDDELCLIYSECCLNVGIEEFNNGNLHAAVEQFDIALEYCEKTIYNTEVTAARANAYFEYMKQLSPSLSSDIADDDMPKVLLVDDLFCTYCEIFCKSEQDGILSIPYLDAMLSKIPTETSYGLHISARIKMEEREYGEAHALLHKLLFENNYELPEPVLYFVFCDMEICCKEIEDFKGAYEYSGSKISLLQKLLS